MKHGAKTAILCVRIVAIALFAVGAILVATIPLWGKHFLGRHASTVTVNPFCAVNLVAEFGEADCYVVSGPDGERTYLPEDCPTFCTSGEYLVRCVTTNEHETSVRKHTLTVRNDTVAPTASLSCATTLVPLGAGLVVRVSARDNFAPADYLTLSCSAQNADVVAITGGYLVFPTAEGSVSITLTVCDYAQNASTHTLALSALPSSQGTVFLCQGKVAYDATSIYLVQNARAQMIDKLPVGTYELTITGGTLTVYNSSTGAIAYTQKRLLVEVTEQGALVNGVWVNGAIALSFEGTDVTLTSSAPLFD